MSAYARPAMRMRRAQILSGFFILSLLFLSCASSSSRGMFAFTSKPAQNVQSDKDSLGLISFSPNDKSVCFQFTNKSGRPAVIDWEFAALVLDGSVQKIIHDSAAYATGAFHVLPKTTIPPKKHLEDCLYPVGRIQVAGNGWHSKDLFKKKKNWFDEDREHSLSIYLPVKFGSEKRIYRAAWTVIDTTDRYPKPAGRSSR